MKTTFKIFAHSPFFGFATVSFAQNTATESSTIGARIIAPIGLANNQGLEFGDIIKAAERFAIAPAAGTGMTLERESYSYDTSNQYPYSTSS